MANAVRGVRTLGMTTDREGNRTYAVRYLVYRDDVDDGPAAVAMTTGLPQFGAAYSDGKTDSDPWAFRTFETEVRRHEELDGEVGHYWTVDCTFTTVSPTGRDLSEMNRANGGSPPTDSPPGKGNPTDQSSNPPQISVSFTRYTTQSSVDYLDRPITTSSHELIRGPDNEWDMSRIQIRIKQTVTTAELQLPMLCHMVDTVNARDLWGFPPRTLKLSEAPVEWKYYGNGNPYFERTLVFDVRYRARTGVTSVPTGGTGTELLEELVEDDYVETWDRYVLDEGTKVLKGHWGPKGSPQEGQWVLETVNGAAPDPNNPMHFRRFYDTENHPGRVILNGEGAPANTVVVGVPPTGTDGSYEESYLAPAGRRVIKYYGQSDFASIPHLPTSLVPLVVP